MQERDPSAFNLFIQIKSREENIVLAFDSEAIYSQWRSAIEIKSGGVGMQSLMQRPQSKLGADFQHMLEHSQYTVSS